ncbi:MAG: hypothetical protein Q9187_005026 [Circinaria calcarea]
MAAATAHLDRECVYTEHSVVESLQDWSHGAKSKSLWILGVYEDIYPSSTSAIAAKVINTALELKIPLLCFFCNIPEEDEETTDNEEDTTSREEATVIDLLYTLIRQAIELLPRQISTESHLTKSRFTRLDGTFETFDEAFDILTDLLYLIPDTFLIIIDGIEQLDDIHVDEKVTDILELLRKVTLQESSKPKKVVKILYTTAGPCDALEGLDDDHLEVVKANPRKALRSPGHQRKGKVILHADFDSRDETSDDDSCDSD